MCEMQKAHPNRRISYFKLHTCGMRNLRPHPESTESFSKTWDLKAAKERRKLDVWDEEGVKDEASEREEDFATGARWRGRGEGEDGDWATERAPRVVIVVPGDTECWWGNDVYHHRRITERGDGRLPFLQAKWEFDEPTKPSFTKTTNHRANLSLRRCKPSPVFVPLFLPRFLTLQIAVSTETLQGACVVGVVNKRTGTHEWMQTHLSDLKCRSLRTWWRRIPFWPVPTSGRRSQRTRNLSSSSVHRCLSWDNCHKASITPNSICYWWWLQRDDKKSSLTRIVGEAGIRPLKPPSHGHLPQIFFVSRGRLPSRNCPRCITDIKHNGL